MIQPHDNMWAHPVNVTYNSARYYIYYDNHIYYLLLLLLIKVDVK